MLRRCLGALVVCALVPACLREPVFRGGDGGVGDGASDGPATSSCANAAGTITAVKAPDESVEVCGPGYRMVFGKDGAHFPVSFEVGGKELLANGRTCSDDRGVGVSIFPVALVNGEPNDALLTPRILVELPGPVIAKVAIDWTLQYNCNGTSATLGSRTTFTFFPDGRISRYDRYDQNGAIANSGSCASVCSGGRNGPLAVAGYFTVVANPQTSTLTPNLTANLADYPAEVTGEYGMCLETMQEQLAFGWPHAVTRIRVADAMGTTSRSLSFAFGPDTATSAGPFQAEVYAMTMFVGDGTRTCAALRDLAMYNAGIGNHDLDRNGDPGSAMGRTPDGFYGGELPGISPGYPVDLPLTLSPNDQDDSFPGGWAFWAELDGLPTTNITVKKNGVPVNHRQQVTAGDQVIFWFPEPLGVSETLTIARE